MESMITPNPFCSLSLLPIDPAERRAQDKDRMARLATLDSEQLPLALAFLVGYLTFAFDTALEATDPPAGTANRTWNRCTKCNARVGEFLPTARATVTTEAS
jgi:hypothetical protein